LAPVSDVLSALHEVAKMVTAASASADTGDKWLFIAWKLTTPTRVVQRFFHEEVELPPPNTGASVRTMKSTFARYRLGMRTLERVGLVGCLLASVAACGSEKATSGGAASAGDSVLERNNHPSRDGHFVQPTLTTDAVAKFARDTGFAAKFDGAMWASPLYLAKGPAGKGVFFAVTTGNDVIALDETTGAVVWKTNIGDSPTANGVNCGNIHPLGILSTPVIDAASGTIYVAGAIGTASIAKHEVHALNVLDGTERKGFPIDVTGMTSGAQTFVAPPENQRSALSLVAGTLYVAYGGHVGDCGPYHGWVVAINTADPTQRGAWATLGQGEGIWAAGGMASDGKSVFAVTGNSTVGAPDRTASDSEQVVRLSGLAAFTRSEQNLFFPKTWKTMDDADADFGSSNPLYLSVPGSTPANYVAAVAKDGHLYLLNSSNLGGMDGQTVDFMVSTGAMSVHTSPAAYTTAKGVHIVMTTDTGAACPGGDGGKSVISSLITPGSPPTVSAEWCAPLGSTVTSPIATTSDGTHNAIVWYSNGGILTAVDGDTGKSLFVSTDSCAGVRQWTSPIAVKGRIIVGGDGNLCSWSAH
jgi:hypothetical protein